MRETVISIDPAPSKTSTVCDGKACCEKTAAQLRALLRGVGSNTLICWDAPLTGPRDPDQAGEACRDFSQRFIDSFFSRGATGFKTPKGISVLPYSGCPHWAISRSLLGLPRTGPYDAHYEELPFHLLPGEDRKEDSRPSVVETHPAVAAWLWCRGLEGFPGGTEERPAPWLYKKDPGLRTRMWRVIRRKTREVACPDPRKGDDDDFDAAVGYLLGVLYLRDRDKSKSCRKVILLGDRELGSFLVPNVDCLLEKWRKFVEEWSKVRLLAAEQAALRAGGVDLEARPGRDPLAMTAVKYAAIVQRSLTSREVGERLRLADGRVSQLIADRSLYSFLMESRCLIPEFQFLPGGGLVPNIGVVNRALSPRLHPVEVFNWLHTRNADLFLDEESDVNVSPREWLRAGHNAAPVALLASRL